MDYLLAIKRITALLSVALFLSVSNGWAQGSIFTNLGSDLKRADRLYEQLAYAPAAELYQKELGRSKRNQDDIKVKLARCYYQLNRPDQAAYWYEQVLAKDSLLTEQDRLRFAHALSGDQQYTQAKEQYEMLWPQPFAQKKLQGLNDLNQFYQDSSYYQVERLNINTEAAEFSPSYYQDGILFASSRSRRSPVQRTFRWDQLPFLDLYYAPLDSSGLAGKPKRLTRQVNTKFHEGAVALLDSGRRMIFTRNNFYDGKKNQSSERINKLKLYQADRRGDSWTNVTPLPFNSDEYSTGHPAVSPDGKTLYFVSDAAGGEGGTDLYTREYDSGRWGTPHNMGAEINTIANEMFPFVDAEGVLYFASGGHAGLGGLDIFRVLPHGSLQNMGYPVNTHRDDFGLVLNETGDTGYFSSNRLRGGADDDLYVVAISRPPTLLVEGHVTDDETQESLDEAVVVLKDEQGQTIDTTTTDEGGNYTFEVPKGKKYSTVVSRDEYQTNEQDVDATDPDPSIATLRVENALPKNRIIVEGRVLDRETRADIDSTTVALINEATGEIEQEVTVEMGGKFRFQLQPDQRYEVKAGRQTYLGAVESIDTKGFKNELILRNLMLDRVTLNEAFRLDIIYYDFDRWNIRPTAAQELDKLVDFMQNNPTYEVELGSHTDSRGNDTYNQYLSQKRSESAVEYIISKGIARSRITARGYGETQITNGCVDDVSCTPAQHQQNRRTEFTVVRE